MPWSRLGGLSGADNNSANAPKPAISGRIPLIMHAIIVTEFSMTRAGLFTRRFAATGIVLFLAFVLLRFLWFPDGYFLISGVAKLFLILLAVNVIVGPGLSTLVYKPGKWGLKFDLIAIACIELAILSWGMHEILQRRPDFAVFAVDRFEAVAAAEVDLAQTRNTPLASRPGQTPRLIYASLPTDPEVMNRLIDETVFLGMQDIDRRPEFWRPYAEGMPLIKAAARPLAELISDGGSRAGVLKRWLANQDLPVADYVFLPIKGRARDGVVILHADIGFPVDVLAVDPW
jgi:hypothetical protein